MNHFIGSGCHINVFTGIRKYDKLKVAIKQSKEKLMFLSTEKKQKINEEIANKKAIDHPFIVRIIDDFEDKEGHLCLVQEFFGEGDFNKYLKERKGKLFSEQEILSFLANIFLAVLHMNSINLFHRYIKPGNFMMKREANGKTYLHLSNFGIANNIADKESF
jgi:serine/threonine protein kinase